MRGLFGVQFGIWLCTDSEASNFRAVWPQTFPGPSVPGLGHTARLSVVSDPGSGPPGGNPRGGAPGETTPGRPHLGGPTLHKHMAWAKYTNDFGVQNTTLALKLAP